jgi:hypothetical protein
VATFSRWRPTFTSGTRSGGCFETRRCSKIASSDLLPVRVGGALGGWASRGALQRSPSVVAADSGGGGEMPRGREGRVRYSSEGQGKTARESHRGPGAFKALPATTEKTRLLGDLRLCGSKTSDDLRIRVCRRCSGWWPRSPRGRSPRSSMTSRSSRRGFVETSLRPRRVPLEADLVWGDARPCSFSHSVAQRKRSNCTLSDSTWLATAAHRLF